MDVKRHKGKEDDRLFASSWHEALGQAADDLSYLLGKDYPSQAALELVGNRYQLNKRQRMAVGRISAAPKAVSRRKRHACTISGLQGEEVEVDGFNLLILLESVLSGAYVFRCRDGTYRDIASVHGAYSRVVQTAEAVRLSGRALQELGVRKVLWLLDAPISHSGQLREFLYSQAAAHGFSWEVALLHNPDQALAASRTIVITSDSWVLDRADRWFNLGAYLIEHMSGKARVVAV